MVWIRWSGQGAPTPQTSGVAGRGGEGDGLGTAVDLEDHPVGAVEQGAPQDGERGGEEGVGLLVPGRGHPRPAEPEAPRAGALDRLGGAGDDLDRAPVALLAGLAPGDQAVALQQHGPGRGVGVEQVGDAPGHREARALVVEPDDLVAEGLLGQRAARPAPR